MSACPSTVLSPQSAFPQAVPPPTDHASLRQLVAPLVVRGHGRGFESGVQYRGVYPHVKGGMDPGRHWRGKVKFFDGQVNLPPQPTAVLAAAQLAHWWECRLGPRWGEILAAHGWGRGGQQRSGGRVWRHAPWRILKYRGERRRVLVRTAPPGGERSNVDKKFYRYGERMPVRTEPCYVVCWVRGERTVVGEYEDNVFVPTLFQWRRDAAWGLFAWLDRKYGAGPLLWFREDEPYRGVSSHPVNHHAGNA